MGSDWDFELTGPPEDLGRSIQALVLANPGTTFRMWRIGDNIRVQTSHIGDNKPTWVKAAERVSGVDLNGSND